MHSSKNSGNSSAQSLQPGFWFQCAEQTVWKNRKGRDSRWEMKTFGQAVLFFSCREAVEAEKKNNLTTSWTSVLLTAQSCLCGSGHWTPSDAVLWEGLKATSERNKKKFYVLSCTARQKKKRVYNIFYLSLLKVQEKGFSSQSQPVGWWWSCYMVDAKKKFSRLFLGLEVHGTNICWCWQGLICCNWDFWEGLEFWEHSLGKEIKAPEREADAFTCLRISQCLES